MTLGKLLDPICVYALFCMYLYLRPYYKISLWALHASVSLLRLSIQDCFLTLLIFATPSAWKRLAQNRWLVVVCQIKCRVVKLKDCELFVKCRGLYHCRLLKIKIWERSCNRWNENFDKDIAQFYPFFKFLFYFFSFILFSLFQFQKGWDINVFSVVWVQVEVGINSKQ